VVLVIAMMVWQIRSLSSCFLPKEHDIVPSAEEMTVTEATFQNGKQTTKGRYGVGDFKELGDSVDNNNSVVPKVIWMLWLQGWDNLEVLAKEGEKVRRNKASDVILSVKSWKLLKSDEYTLELVDEDKACWLTNRSDYIPDPLWNEISPQAKSDVLRTLLLFHYGGIWADVSVTLTVPIDMWLDLRQSDLFAFQRFNNAKDQRKKDIGPWISSWFLVAPPRAYTIEQILNIIVREPERIKNEYFWWHRIVSELARKNERIARRITTHFPSAEPLSCRSMHSKQPLEIAAPILKRCALDKIRLLMPYAESCCHHPHSLTRIPKNETCSKWDCNSLAQNWDLV